MSKTLTNIKTLQIHKLSQKQYDAALANGEIDPNALYLTSDEEISLPKISYGTEEPDGGSPGDLYIQIIE
jgi:hypothetical protein